MRSRSVIVLLRAVGRQATAYDIKMSYASALAGSQIGVSRRGLTLISAAAVATVMAVILVTLAERDTLRGVDLAQQGYRVFLKANEPGRGRFQQLPMVPGPMPMQPSYPMPHTTVYTQPAYQPPPEQTIRPVFNVIPNPGSADALRRLQDQVGGQRVAMNELKENLGYVRQVVDGLKAQLALQTSGKKAVTFTISSTYDSHGSPSASRKNA